MSRLAFVAALLVPTIVACTDVDAPSIDEDMAAAEELPVSAAGKADTSWDVAPTLHVGQRQFDRAAAGGRRVFPVWIAGSASAPVPLDVTAAVASEGGSVRIAVLGPLKNGTRAVLAAGGYASPKTDVEVSLKVKTTGEHLIVIGSHDLSDETFFEVAATSNADARKLDVLASPKAGALVATGTNMVQAELGSVLANRNYDVELELWASKPMQPWNAVKVATSVASGTQANVIVPASVKPGDDLRLVVRKAGGAVLDAGVPARFFPQATTFVRTDAILYGDLVSVQVAGVVGFFEGHASLELRNETRHRIIDTDEHEVSMPGHVGNGFNAFDATFDPAITLENGSINPDLPRNGDLLSVGYINGNGDFRRLGCFEYCNDLSGMETCTGGTRTCPTTAW